MATKKWVNKAIKKPGALRESLHIKEGKTIPVSILKEKAKQPGKMGQRARLALTMRSWKHK